MSDSKKSVKRRPRVLEARDLMSVTGGAPTGGSMPGPTVGMFPQGPRNPRPWEPQGPQGPRIGFAPQGPRIGFLPDGSQK